MTTHVNNTLEQLYELIEIDSAGCWNWKRSLVGGYGQVILPDGRTQAAHRYSFKLHNGYLTEDLFVCHKCDNTRCINPEHLFEGTNTDNMRDMWQKGRGPNNALESNPNSKLTIEQVKQIRKIGHTVPYSETAKQFDVTPEMISLIVRGKYWNDV